MPVTTRGSREQSLDPFGEPSESEDPAWAEDAIPPAERTASGFPEQVDPYTGGGAAARATRRADEAKDSSRSQGEKQAVVIYRLKSTIGSARSDI